VNEQESYLWEAAQAIGRTRPCPVSIAEQMPNTMIPQWHRGSDWAVAHARRFRDEVLDRIEPGPGASSNERIRLMWIGGGVWHDPRCYKEVEERIGVVFTRTTYVRHTGTQCIRDFSGDSMEALTSSYCSMNEVLHQPPWIFEWMPAEAKRCSIDAGVWNL